MGSPRRGTHPDVTLVDPTAQLTPRETEVLSYIAVGLSNREIAAELFLSVNSVKSHIRSAYRKIGVTRRVEAVRWAIRNDLDAQVLPAPPAGLEPAT